MAKSQFEGAALMLNPNWQGNHTSPLHELYGIPADTKATLAPHQFTGPNSGIITVQFAKTVKTTQPIEGRSGEVHVYKAGKPYMQPASNWVPVEKLEAAVA